jgi:hypothetical protein
MFYFKTVSISDTDPQLVEKAIRQYTKMRSTYLDFRLTAQESHDNKFFSGLEKNKFILLTRMRDQINSPQIVNYKPSRYRKTSSLFIRFNKEKGFASYQLGLSYWGLVTGFIFLFFFALIWINILGYLGSIVLLPFIWWLLYLNNREIKLTQEFVNRVLQRARKEQII